MPAMKAYKIGLPPDNQSMSNKPKSRVFVIAIAVILTALITGSLLFYRAWRVNQILFVGDYHGEKPGIYRYNLLSHTPILIADNTAATPRWSPDGNRIAYILSQGSNGGPPYHLAVMDKRGNHLWQTGEGEVRQYSPAWSPDGKQIAYISARDYAGGGPLAIFVINSDGSDPQQLTPYAYYSDLSWSPDGQTIAFSTFNAIHVVSADGTEFRQLTDQHTDSFPVWSPDGEFIAFQSTRENEEDHFDIYVMRADGSDIRRLTTDAAHDRLPSWSPDGRRIIFESNRDSDDWLYHIYIMNADGSGQERLVEIESNFPVWRP